MVVDSDEWFDNPLDRMPIATDRITDEYAPCDVEYDNKYAPPEKLAELESMELNPRPEEEVADWFADDVKEDDQMKKEKKTIHHKMYEIATSKYNPFSVGGSESITDFGGGSEKVQS
tara:strand:+ start:254 stop:604 length:351 start_codon:yes stop_codon:yes gene_type:complete